MRTSLLRTSVLIAALLPATSLVLADPPSDAELESALCAPLEGVRDAARTRLLREPTRARTLARTWVTHERPDLREQAWQLLARVGRPVDVRPALHAVQRESEGPVAGAAASALVALAGRFANERGAWLSTQDEIGPSHRRVLALAMLEVLRQSDDVPQVVMHLGEGCTTWLEQAYACAPEDRRVRHAVVRSLGRLACGPARAALAGMANDPTLDKAVWLNALRACGNGPELDPVHELVLAFTLEGTSGSRWVQWPRRREWRPRRAREAFYRFIAERPDDRWAEGAREALRDVLGNSQWHASLVVTAARALVVLGDPTDDDIELMVDAAASPPFPRRDPGRFEGLGDVFRALRPYRAREALQDELEGRDGEAVPRTSRAWIALLSDDATDTEAREMARALLLGEPPLVACLRAGARILDASGGPPADLVKTFLDHEDPWLRAWALKWCPRRLPTDEAIKVLRKAARDPHSGVALVVAERTEAIGDDHDLVRRTLRTATFDATPSHRGRAWRVLERVLRVAAEASESSADAITLPRADAPMDERLRAAATVRAWLQANSRVEDSDEALPDGGGEVK